MGLVVERTHKWVSIAGVIFLGSLITICELAIPNKKDSLAELAEVYRADVAKAQVPEAFAAETTPPPAPEIEKTQPEEYQRPALARPADDHEEVLRTLDDAEDQLLELASNRGKAPQHEEGQTRELLEAKRSLESQQEGLIQEINRLRKQLQIKSNSETLNQADSVATNEQIRQLTREKQTLSQEVLTLREKSANDRSNLSLLADHILKLRSALKESQADTKRLNSELESAQSEAEGADHVSSENSRLNDDLVNAKTQRERIVAQLDASQKRNKELELAVEDLRKTIQGLGGEKTEAQKQLVSNREEVKSVSEELLSTKRALSKTIQDAKTCGSSLETKTELASRLPDLEARIKQLETSLNEKEKDNRALAIQLRDKEELVSNIPGLKKQLLASKNQLILKDRELSILGTGASHPAARQAFDQEAADRALERTGRQAGEETLRGKNVDLGSDVMVVEVLASRVALRSGPSPDDSEISAVGKGTRLTVEERSGDWYRVIAPNSVRAYIRSDMVRVVSNGNDTSMSEPPVRRMRATPPQKRALKAVIDDPSMEPFGDVNGSGLTGDKEERAFQKLRRGVGNTDSRPPEMIPE